MFGFCFLVMFLPQKLIICFKKKKIFLLIVKMYKLITGLDTEMTMRLDFIKELCLALFSGRCQVKT